jgi:hypothetical protein
VSAVAPLAVLGDDGVLRYMAIAGARTSVGTGFTDAMDMIGTRTPVPAPGACAILGLSTLAGRSRRRIA